MTATQRVLEHLAAEAQAMTPEEWTAFLVFFAGCTLAAMFGRAWGRR